MNPEHVRELRVQLEDLESKVLSGELDAKGIRRYVRNLNEYWRKRGYTRIGQLIGSLGQPKPGRKPRKVTKVTKAKAKPTPIGTVKRYRSPHWNPPAKYRDYEMDQLPPGVRADAEWHSEGGRLTSVHEVEGWVQRGEIRSGKVQWFDVDNDVWRTYDHRPQTGSQRWRIVEDDNDDQYYEDEEAYYATDWTEGDELGVNPPSRSHGSMGSLDDPEFVDMIFESVGDGEGWDAYDDQDDDTLIRLADMYDAHIPNFRERLERGGASRTEAIAELRRAGKEHSARLKDELGIGDGPLTPEARRRIDEWNRRQAAEGNGFRESRLSDGRPYYTDYETNIVEHDGMWYVSSGGIRIMEDGSVDNELRRFNTFDEALQYAASLRELTIDSDDEWDIIAAERERLQHIRGNGTEKHPNEAAKEALDKTPGWHSIPAAVHQHAHEMAEAGSSDDEIADYLYSEADLRDDPDIEAFADNFGDAYADAMQDRIDLLMAPSTPQEQAQAAMDQFERMFRTKMQQAGVHVDWSSLWYGAEQGESPDDLADIIRGPRPIEDDLTRQSQRDMYELRQYYAKLFLDIYHYGMPLEDKVLARTPGGRLGDPTSRNLSPKKNWVDKAGGLPKYIRFVRNALLREGHTSSSAHRLAVAAVKRWARGGGNVSPKVQAAAAKAVAEWEAKRAKARATKDLEGAALELKRRLSRVARTARQLSMRSPGGTRRVRVGGVFRDRKTGRGLKPGDPLVSGEYVRAIRRPPSPPVAPTRGVMPGGSGGSSGTQVVTHAPSSVPSGAPTRAQLQALVKLPVQGKPKPLGGGGGTGAYTSEYDFGGGRKAVRKVFQTTEEAKAEYISSLLGQAIGAPVPTVIFDETDQTGRSIWISHISGDMHEAWEDAQMNKNRGAVRTPHWRRQYEADLRRHFDTRRAVRIGLLDALTVNRDRHGGNHMVDDAGDVWGIDHGEMFRYRGFVGRREDGSEVALPDYERFDISRNRGPFVLYFASQIAGVDAKTGRVVRDNDPTLRGGRSQTAFLHEYRARTGRQVRFVWDWSPNPLTADEVSEIETALILLRPEFVRMHRGYWHDEMMKRWAQIKLHAVGARADITSVLDEILTEY